MMSIALDATLWDEPITGIGLYTKELYSALSRSGTQVERWGARHSGEMPRHHRQRTAWTLGTLPTLLQRRAPRVFHALSNFNLPMQRVPGVAYVLTVHDVVPLLLPHTVSTRFRLQFRLWLARSLTVAHRVICNSHTTRDSVLAHFEVDADKVEVIHLGVNHVDRLATTDAITEQWLDTLGFHSPWVLYAGALDARKNVELVLKAVEQLRDKGTPVTLVLAGQRWFGAGAIETAIRQAQARGVDVRPMGYLEDVAFYGLMRRASAFVFPSRYEGFGLPPLEAMRLGVPTIVSTEGALPEVCGGGAAQVGPDDVDGLAHLLSTWLESASLRESWASKARLRAQDFSWEKAATLTARAYDNAIASATTARRL